jgi:peptide deformylase
MYVEVVGIEADSLILRAHNEEFTLDDLKSKAFRTLAAKMLRTVTDPSQDGVGIAAPQVGINRRVIAVQRFDREGEPFGIFPNARLDSLWGDITHDPEGCLSIPGKRGLVPRYTNIRVSYTDPETLEKVTEEVEGFTAIIFQHEIDHLEGVLYTDKADSVYVD